jgi:hypothetical protein
VIPPIFASSLLSLPTVANFNAGQDQLADDGHNPAGWPADVSYSLMR